jgi:hypothetical protein
MQSTPRKAGFFIPFLKVEMQAAEQIRPQISLTAQMKKNHK